MRFSVLFCFFYFVFSDSFCYANEEWFVYSGNNSLSSNSEDHPLAKEEPNRFTPWVLLLSSNSEDHPLAKELKKLTHDKREIKSVAITPGGDWVILAGANEIHTNNPNLLAVKKLMEWQNGHTLNCVAFSPTGEWVVFWDKTGSWRSSGIPEDAGKKIDELAKDASNLLRSIAFFPHGGWVCLCNENGLYYSGVPADLKTVLDEAFNKRIPIRCVWSTSFGEWFVVTDKKCWTSDANHPAAKRIEAQIKAGQSPRWIVTAPVDLAKTQLSLEIKAAQRIKAELLSTVTHPDGGKVEEYVAFAPEAPNLPGQKAVRTTLSPEGKIVRDDGPLKRSLFQVQITDGRKELRANLTIDATLMSRKLRPIADGETAHKVADLPSEERRCFSLFADSLGGEIDPEGPKPGTFSSWVMNAGLKRKEGEGEVVFAYRVFRHIKHRFQYQFPTGDQSASAVCGTGKSDCSGLCNLFVCVLRSNGIPARILAGRMASSGKQSIHVRAEFFASGIGWVPVDCAAAVNDKFGGDLEYFGNDPGDHITLTIDPTGTVDTNIVGKQRGVAYQGVAFWWRGSSGNKSLRLEETWTVKKEPLEKHAPQ